MVALKHLIFGIAFLVLNPSDTIMAHKSIEDDDDSFLLQREGGAGLETAGLAAKYEKQINKYPLMHNFSGEKETQRGSVIVTRNAES